MAYRLDMTETFAGVAPVAVGRPASTMMIITTATSEAGRTHAS
ncbi:hypothetical protein [Phenylobacterium sp.]|nr:hypothetical protein [Phenylobacterium sp.]